jgi:hypothetical protein
MNRWRVGEDRGSKETDGFPLQVLIQCDTKGEELLVIV